MPQDDYDPECDRISALSSRVEVTEDEITELWKELKTLKAQRKRDREEVARILERATRAET